MCGTRSNAHVQTCLRTYLSAHTPAPISIHMPAHVSTRHVHSHHIAPKLFLLKQELGARNKVTLRAKNYMASLLRGMGDHSREAIAIRAITI